MSNNDLISRKALKEEFNNIASEAPLSDMELVPICSFISFIDNAPTVARLQGEWNIEHDWVHCSSCGHEQNYPSNFCPNCGADMKHDT